MRFQKVLASPCSYVFFSERAQEQEKTSNQLHHHLWQTLHFILLYNQFAVRLALSCAEITF